MTGQPPADQPLRPLYDDFRDANNKGRLDTVQGSGGLSGVSRANRERFRIPTTTYRPASEPSANMKPRAPLAVPVGVAGDWWITTQLPVNQKLSRSWARD